MKILFINQFFWPDSSATSQLLTDLVRGLTERGHSISVVCAESGYAPAISDNPPSAKVLRLKSLPFGRGRVGRVLSYASFYVSAAVKVLTISRPDIVVSMTTPPLISLLGWSVQRLRGAEHFIWEMDVYPDVAVDLRYIERGGMIHRVTGSLADAAREAADGIFVLGECMKARLARHGVDPARMFITENWADAKAIQPREFSDDPSRVVLLYSGNLGLAHDTETMLQAMLALKGDPAFRLLIVGGGARRTEVASFCDINKVESIQLLPYADRSELSSSLSSGDIGVVTQKDVCLGSVVPSKLYGILAAGRPILFIGPRDATPAETVRRFGCGWHIECGDVVSLTRLLLHLAAHPAEIRNAGLRARVALLQHFDLPIGIARIAQILEALSSRSPMDRPAAASVDPISTTKAA